ncbi:MAG: poly-beta-1,6-N-acetyl-D-glucosamine N-deacetylase PgaB [Sphingopyxis terrae]|nr:MAG: poly-beta-1,6-N-acetyl-D-glucosamine N-deacetylase PgaB [Sphingopyxis terrae]
MRLIVRLIVLVASLGIGWAQAQAQAPDPADGPGIFVSIGLHQIDDHRDRLETEAITGKVLTEFFDWLRGTGWTAVSLDDLAAARRGERPLPPKAILLTADDGYKSLYNRIFPLLKAYRFPLVASVTGSWMEGPADGVVLYGDRAVPRSTFISWEQAREMQASGLVEFASHSYDLHRGVQANPQGNLIAAAATWRYDQTTGRYEDDAEFKARIRADLSLARRQMSVNLGRAPRAIAWPYGRFSGPARDVARELGFTFALTFEAEPSSVSDLFSIGRYYPARNATLGDIARNLRFDPERPLTRRIACLRLDHLAASATPAAQDEALGRIIEDIRALGANTVIVDANAALPSPDAPLAAVFFPTDLLPVRADMLSHAAWQLRTRAGVDVFLRLPPDAAARAIGASQVPRLFADMARYTTADGYAVAIAPAPDLATPIADAPAQLRARRERTDIASLAPDARAGFVAFRAATAIDPLARLLVPLKPGETPSALADIGLLPPVGDADAASALAARLRKARWLSPDNAGRIAIALPADPDRQVEALRQAQRQGASAFALCPDAPLPPSAALSAAFSAATYPYRP